MAKYKTLSQHRVLFHAGRYYPQYEDISWLTRRPVWKHYMEGRMYDSVPYFFHDLDKAVQWIKDIIKQEHHRTQPSKVVWHEKFGSEVAL